MVKLPIDDCHPPTILKLTIFAAHIKEHSMFDNVDILLKEIKAAEVQSKEELESFRIRFLGSKNIIKPLFAEMRNVDPADRKAYGLALNKLKTSAEI